MEGDPQAPYDIEKVLEGLGELDNKTANAKENSKKKEKKAKKKRNPNQQNGNKGEPNLSQMPINNPDPNEPRNCRATTPIYTAAEKNHIEKVKTLTDNPNAPKNNGATPKYNAAQNNHIEVAQLLMNSTDNPNEPNFGASQPEASVEKNKNYRKHSTNGPKIRIHNLDADFGESVKVSNKVKENIPFEVLEYLENIERENQKCKEALGFMETFMKRYEKLNIQNQNLQLQIQTLQDQNLNFENKNTNLEVQAKNLEAQAKNLEDAHMCKICMENEICFVFIPCGHLITCENCAVNRDLKNCPICRKQITKRVKTYLS